NPAYPLPSCRGGLVFGKMRHKGTGLRRDYLKLTSITPDQTEKILKTRLSLDVVFHTNPFIKQFDSFIL
ncbi:MAG: hypothetical protein L0H97_07890, partial [Lactococcus sp.]|nr:hypothetical protein [Lactococcus sp.]